MKVALLTVLRNDLLEHFKYAKEAGMDIDVFTKGSEPTDTSQSRAFISNNNLNEVVYRSEATLLNSLKEYDVISIYEFYGPVQKIIMEHFNNSVPEIAWNIPTYGFLWGKQDWASECLTLAKEKVKSFVARSQSVYDCLTQEGIDKDKISLLHGGCDTDRFKPREKTRFKDKKVLLFVGRVQEQKGIFEIFHTFKRANLKDWVLVYVGGVHPTKPWDKKILQKWIAKEGLTDKVFFIDAVPQPEVHKIFNLGDVFITLPNSDFKFVEQIGLTTPQALASGLPVITYNYGGQADFVDESCGFKVNFKGYPEAAKALIKLDDDSLRNKMSIAAREKAVKEYGMRKYARDIKKAYQLAINNE